MATVPAPVSSDSPASPAHAQIVQTLESAARAHLRLADQGVEAIAAAATQVGDALAAGHTVYAFGNGGSAAAAQHFVAELVGRFVADRPALRAIALSADTSILTAVGHDFGFEHVFARQIDALGRRGDVALGISTSGEAPNVLRAFETARAHGLTTIALTGRAGGTAGRVADVHVNVADESTARIQEVHTTVLHAICELLERTVKVPPHVEPANDKHPPPTR